MSDVGEIMDALVTAAAISGVTAARTLKYADEIGAEDFPYHCFYDPDETSELGDFQLTTQKTAIHSLLFTKGETQEELAVRMDAFRDAIAADRTLGGVVQFAHVASRSILEDPNVDTKAGYMVVETVEQTGKIIRLAIEVEFELAPGFSDWSANDGAFESLADLHMGTGTRLTSDLRADCDTIPADTTRYQLAWVTSEHVEHGSNLNTFNIALRVTALHHLGASSSEGSALHDTIYPKVDGLLNPATWSGIPRIASVLNDTPTLSLDDLERVD